MRDLLERYFDTARTSHRALRRRRREVHRRRGDGRLGHAVAHARTTPSAPSRGARAGRRGQDRRPGASGPRRGADRRSGGQRWRHSTRRWSPAISSTPPPGCSRSPRRAPCSWRGDHARGERAIAFEAAGEHELKGKDAGPGVARAARRGRARRSGRARRTRGAVRRPRRGAAPAQGPAPCHRPREPSRLVSVIGPAASARAAWRGSSRSTSTAWSRPSTGTAAGRRRTARASPSGRWARWSAGAPACRGRRRGDHPPADRRDGRQVRTRPTTSELDRAALLALLGVEPPPGRPRSPVRRLAHVLRAHRRPRSTVLVFEDLHWADAGLLDFIDHLLEWSRACRSIVVALARPELLERRPDWGAGTRTSPRCRSSRCPTAAMRSCSRASCRAARRGRRAIVGRADGIPLYAVETVRMLVPTAGCGRGRRRLPPVGDLGELAVPDTLRSLIASRLDALDPADRALLQDAPCSARPSPRLAGGRRRRVGDRDEGGLRGWSDASLFVQADPARPSAASTASCRR